MPAREHVAEVVRVPTAMRLSPAQLTAVALVADGWSYEECARLMGVQVGTFTSHLNTALTRIPGDLPGRAKAIAWYRGASADVLGVDRADASRQESLHRAYTIYGGRCCLHCGNLLPHGYGKSSTSGHA